jgi:transcriptional regulator with XRE-family HTH domain
MLEGAGVERFADAVNDLLAEREWSRRNLARAVDVDPGHVSRLLGRWRRPPSPALMQRVADVLGVEPDIFIEYREWLVIEAVRSDAALREQLYRRLHRPAAASMTA